MRAIVRFSVDGERNGALRNQLAATLERYGFALNPNVTATWEHDNIGEADLSAAMTDFWQRAHNPPGNARLDHFWMYSDNPPQ